MTDLNRRKFLLGASAVAVATALPTPQPPYLTRAAEWWDLAWWDLANDPALTADEIVAEIQRAIAVLLRQAEEERRHNPLTRDARFFLPVLDLPGALD